MSTDNVEKDTKDVDTVEIVEDPKDTEGEVKTYSEPKFDFVAECEGVSYRFSSRVYDENVTQYTYYDQRMVVLKVFQIHKEESKGVFECSSDLKVRFNWDPETLEPIKKSMKVESEGKEYTIDNVKMKPLMDQYIEKKKKEIEEGRAKKEKFFKMTIPSDLMFDKDGKRMDPKTKDSIVTFVCEFNDSDYKLKSYTHYFCPGDIDQSEIDQLVADLNNSEKVDYDLLQGGDIEISYGMYQSIKNCYCYTGDFRDYMLIFDDW